MSNNNDDISIEEELLKVTSSGDSSKRSKKKSSKKRKSKKYSSSSESEEGQLSHSDADEPKHRKPLKKRKVGEGGYSSNEEKGEYGADLVGDEEDRKYLNSLTELEREEIIAERFQKRKEQQEYEELKKSINKSKTSSPSQSQSRQSKRAQSKHDALSDFRKKRQRAKAGSKHSSSSSSSESESSFSESEDDYRRDKKNKKKSRDRSSRSKDESEDEFEIKEDQERPSAEDEKLSLEDVNAICLKRTFLEQKCEEHYFDKMVEGFFVRVGMTSTSDRRVYLLTQVVQVKELPKKYTLGSKKTNKYLVLGIGTSTKQFSMDVVSNSPVDEEEFSRWCKQMEKFKLPIITKQQAQEKVKEFQHFRNYVYTEEDVNKMIEKRKKARNLPMNLSAERARLLSLKVAAQESGNQQEAESVSKELDLIEQKIKKQEEKARKTPDKATLINQKNRELELDKSAMIDHSHSWITDPDLDPFSRRQTKSFNSFIRKEDKEGSKEQQPTTKEASQPQQQSVENKQPPKKPKASLLLKTDLQDPETALKNAHDFDLDKLNISTPQVPTNSVLVEENNQKPAKKTLSVEDYKRRRGLV